jgi:hypothetical protein
MNPSAFGWTLRNRRRVFERPLVAGDAPSSVVTRAARQAASRERAQRAWERVVTPAWLAATWVESAWDGLIEIGVRDQTWERRVHEHQRELLRQMRERVRGARAIHPVVVPAGE